MRSVDEILQSVTAAMQQHDVAQLDALYAELSANEDPRAKGACCRIRGHRHYISGEIEEALKEFREGLSFFEHAGDERGIADLSNNIGNCHIQRNQAREAAPYYARALELRERLQDEAGVAGVLMNQAHTFKLIGDIDAALNGYWQAVERGQRSENLHLVGSAYLNLANTYGSVGDHRTAIGCATKGLETADLLGAAPLYAVLYRTLGNQHTALGEYEQALEWHTRGLDLARQLKSRSEEAQTLHQLAVVHIHMGDFDRGRSLLDQALEIHLSLKAFHDVSSVYNAFGHIHASKKEPEEALRYFKQALDIVEEHEFHNALSNVLANMASTLTALGRYDEAEAILQRMDTMNDLYAGPIRVRRMTRAKLAEARGNYEEARSILMETLQTPSVQQEPKEQLVVHEALRDLAKTMMDFDAYIEHNQQYNEIKERIQGAEVLRRIASQDAERRIAVERQARDKERAVLYSTLPKHIADRIVRGEQVTGDHYDNAAVIFVDIVGFTQLSDQLSASDVVTFLERLFSQFDEICKRHGVTKIKTIGDSYMAVAFSEQPNNRITEQPNTLEQPNTSEESSTADPSHRAANAALDIMRAVADFELPTVPRSTRNDSPTPSFRSPEGSPERSPERSPEGSPERSHVSVRIGVHCGALTAGVIGTERLQYDVWGDTVNVASRLESTGEPGKIQVSETFAQALGDASLGDASLGLRPRNDRPHQDDSQQNEEGAPVIANRSEEPGTWHVAHGTWHLALRGDIDLKGKGTMTTYWLEAREPLPA